jgi:lipopolysaccharide export system ATP-binding protein
MGLVRPDSGRILLDGVDITNLPMYRRAILGLGYLPQETSIFRGLTVEQNIAAVLELAEPDKEVRERNCSACSTNSASTGCAAARRWRCRAGSGGAAKLPGRWPPTRRSCCWTSRSPASTRFRSADIRDLVTDLKDRGIGVLDHRSQRPRNARHRRSRLHHLRRAVCCSRAARKSWWPMKTCGGSTSARASRSRI